MFISNFIFCEACIIFPFFQVIILGTIFSTDISVLPLKLWGFITINSFNNINSTNIITDNNITTHTNNIFLTAIPKNVNNIHMRILNIYKCDVVKK